MTNDHMQALLKMAQVQTILDCVKLLEYLKQETSSQHWKDLDEMILRLSNMAQSL